VTKIFNFQTVTRGNSVLNWFWSITFAHFRRFPNASSR